MIVILLFLTLILFVVFKKRFIFVKQKTLSNNGGLDPLKVLKTRLIEGEITKKEFTQIRKHLGI